MIETRNQNVEISRPPANALWIGIGNDGRNDDGLGWAFLDRLKPVKDDANLVYRFQLQIEDAELINRCEHVVFVDASKQPLPGGFRFERCLPCGDIEFTSHQLSPQTVLSLCHQLYGYRPNASLLTIEGRQWDMHIGLTGQAHENLEAALKFFAS